ncbi:unnamed protein product [Umbelopsis sp. WA50703]
MREASPISRPQPVFTSADPSEGKLFDGENTPQNIATYGFGLGLLAGLSGALAIIGYGYGQIWMFLSGLAVFHFLEYLATALFNGPKLSLDSFLINHSAHYHAAHLAGITEFLVEAYFFPSLKGLGYINWIGLALMISGQAARTIAMFSAKSNFSHHIVGYKAPDHVLVTHGIYSIMRHPSYFGFYWWALGAQVLLMNPVCFFLFIYWLHRFFSERIAYEEHTLSRFFGQEWETYKKNTSTLMPLIA